MSPEAHEALAAAPSHDMLGMRLDAIAPGRYIAEIVEAGGRGEGFYCCIANVHMCVLAHDDPAFRAIVNGARYVIPDSTILQRARALRHGVSAPPTLRGADMMLEIARMAARKGVAIGLVGGRDEAALAGLIERMVAQIPGLSIVYAFSPPFAGMDEAADAAMVADIKAARPGVLFVGLGCPKQERWMAAHVDRIPAAMLGVGAAFDFNAGVVRTSPQWVHKAGLEWAYRLMREPRRLWRRYLTTSPRFLWLLSRDALGRRGRAG